MLIQLGSDPNVAHENRGSGPSGASKRGSHRLSKLLGGCDRQYALSDYSGFRQKEEPGHRAVGSLIHNCLAYHYAPQLTVAPAWLHERTLDEQLYDTSAGMESAVQTAKEVYAAYQQIYAGEPWRAAHVEEEFFATLGELDPGGPYPELDDEIVSCRSDLIVEANGELWVVDYKCSAGEWQKDTLPQWQANGEYRLFWQAIVNLHVLRKRLSRPVRGFIIQRIKRKPPYDFDRHALDIPPLAYADAPRAMRMAVKRENELLAMLDAGKVKPTPNFGQCHHKYGSCDFINLCAAPSREVQELILNKEFVQIGGLRERNNRARRAA